MYPPPPLFRPLVLRSSFSFSFFLSILFLDQGVA